MIRLHATVLLAGAALAALGYVKIDVVDDSAVRLAERRYDDAIARINEETAKERAAEAATVMQACRATLEAAMKAGDLDLAVAMRQKARRYEAISGKQVARPENQVEFG